MALITPVALHPQGPTVGPSAAVRTITWNIGRNGRTRSALVTAPISLTATPRPTLIVLHGHAGSGAVVRRQSQFDREAARLGLVVVYPDGTADWTGVRRTWNAGSCCGAAARDSVDDIAWLDAVVDTLVRAGLTDASRVGLVGFSVGGMLALRAACERPARYATITDIAGAMADIPCPNAVPTTVWFFDGTADDELPTDFRDLRHPSRPQPFAASLDDAVTFWLHVGGCSAPPASLPSQPLARRTDCPNGVSVVRVRIPDHPHAWPGGQRSWWLGPAPSTAVAASPMIADALIAARMLTRDVVPK